MPETYSKSVEFQSGFNADRLEYDIRNSAITIALDYITSDASNVYVYFKDTLPQADKVILDGNTSPAEDGSIIADHVPTPVYLPAQVQIALNVGSYPTVVDGFESSFGQDEWKTGGFALERALEIQDVKCVWKNCQNGDHGWLVVENTAVATVLTAAASAEDTTVEISEAYAPYYAYANFIEFWNSSGDLIEMRGIASVSGTTITLTEGLAEDHASGAPVKCIIQSFSPHRGTHGISGAMHLVGDSSQSFGYEHEVTSAIPAGLSIRSRFKGVDVAGTRNISVNIKFRIPT